MPMLSVVIPVGDDREAALPTLHSALEQDAEMEIVLVAGPGGIEAPLSGGQSFLDYGERVRTATEGDPSPARLRNRGVADARGEGVAVLRPGERLLPGALAAFAERLGSRTGAAAVYARLALLDGLRVLKERPERGASGRIFKDLVRRKDLLVAEGAVVWRRRAFQGRPWYDAIYRTSGALLLELLLRRSQQVRFEFVPRTLVSRPNEREGLEELEEKAKVLLALLYGGSTLSERGEQRVRHRLARHLVAIGKYHYRRGDHERAGRFISEAVKAAPAYYKGRRYQLLNYVRSLLS